MSPKPRTIVAALSVLVRKNPSKKKPLSQTTKPLTPQKTQYLLALTALAAYALHRNNALSLPIPNILAALTIALPSLAGVALETTTSLVTSATASSSSSNSLTTSKKPRISPARASQILHLTLAVLLIYETAVATLAGEHIRASDCGLREVWQGMFHKKDGEGIKAVQDALSCCGFASTRDMAWPFPGAGRGADACVARYDGAGTVSRCLDGLRGEEKKVGWMLMVVPIGVFLWKVSFFFEFVDLCHSAAFALLHGYLPDANLTFAVPVACSPHERQLQLAAVWDPAARRW
jgi:hypothetical protein